MLIDLTQLDRRGNMAFEAHPGGAPANVAVGIARLGGRSRFFGKLSRDFFGDLLLQTLRENGVDTRFVPERSERPTALAIVTLDKSGNRKFAFYHDMSADIQLSPEDIRERIFEGASILHIGSVSMAAEPSRSAMIELVRRAKSAKCLVSCDLNMRENLWSGKEDKGTMLKFLLSNSHIFKCSEEELYLLECCSGGYKSRSSAANYSEGVIYHCIDRIRAAGPALAVITRGRSGAVIGCGDSTVSIPVSRVKAVDTTGAGDAFTAALLYRLVADGLAAPSRIGIIPEDMLRELGRFCNAAAGFSCTRYGGIDSLPTIREVSGILRTAK
jgi:fructokinase